MLTRQEFTKALRAASGQGRVTKVRMLTPAMPLLADDQETWKPVIERVIASLSDPDVEALTIYKPGAHVAGADGRDYLIGPDGEPRLVGVAVDYGFTTC
jgi:hypothetical protein